MRQRRKVGEVELPSITGKNGRRISGEGNRKEKENSRVREEYTRSVLKLDHSHRSSRYCRSQQRWSIPGEQDLPNQLSRIYMGPQILPNNHRTFESLHQVFQLIHYGCYLDGFVGFLTAGVAEYLTLDGTCDSYWVTFFKLDMRSLPCLIVYCFGDSLLEACSTMKGRG